MNYQSDGIVRVRGERADTRRAPRRGGAVGAPSAAAARAPSSSRSSCCTLTPFTRTLSLFLSGEPYTRPRATHTHTHTHAHEHASATCPKLLSHFETKRAFFLSFPPSSSVETLRSQLVGGHDDRRRGRQVLVRGACRQMKRWAQGKRKALLRPTPAPLASRASLHAPTHTHLTPQTSRTTTTTRKSNAKTKNKTGARRRQERRSRRHHQSLPPPRPSPAPRQEPGGRRRSRAFFSSPAAHLRGVGRRGEARDLRRDGVAAGRGGRVWRRRRCWRRPLGRRALRALPRGVPAGDGGGLAQVCGESKSLG